MIRKFALVFGLLYVIAGVMGFIPGIVRPAHDAPPLAVEAGHGTLLGLFTINLLHNIVHLLIGVWGIVGSRSLSGARGVYRDSPALAAGLRPGDVIVEIGGKPVADEGAFRESLRPLKIGQEVSMTVLRDGRCGTARLRLGEAR